jgi:copper chaperone NosL
MKKSWSLIVGLMVVLSLVVGCGKKEYAAVEINEDVDVCAICNMQVKDDPYATQIITKDGKSIKFDDIGCMNAWIEQHGKDNIGMDYVRDYNNKDWISYQKASYVYDASIRTPMAYGIVSFKDKQSAESFIKDQGVGKLMDADDLAKHDWKQSQEMMMHEHSETTDGEHGEESGHGHE